MEEARIRRPLHVTCISGIFLSSVGKKRRRVTTMYWLPGSQRHSRKISRPSSSSPSGVRSVILLDLQQTQPDECIQWCRTRLSEEVRHSLKRRHLFTNYQSHAPHVRQMLTKLLSNQLYVKGEKYDMLSVCAICPQFVIAHSSDWSKLPLPASVLLIVGGVRLLSFECGSLRMICVAFQAVESCQTNILFLLRSFVKSHLLFGASSPQQTGPFVPCVISQGC